MRAAQRVTIVNVKGLHARASAKLAKLAESYVSEIRVHYDGETADATQIMDLLMLAAHKGTEIEITADGTDAPEAVTAIASLVADGFGERDDPNGPART